MNPVACSPRCLEDAPPRREDCAHRGECLDRANREKWSGWSCGSCNDYEKEKEEEPMPRPPTGVANQIAEETGRDRFAPYKAAQKLGIPSVANANADERRQIIAELSKAPRRARRKPKQPTRPQKRIPVPATTQPPKSAAPAAGPPKAAASPSAGKAEVSVPVAPAAAMAPLAPPPSAPPAPAPSALDGHLRERVRGLARAYIAEVRNRLGELEQLLDVVG